MPATGRPDQLPARGLDGQPDGAAVALAAHFAAVLELAKRGQVSLRQGETFAPIELRRRDG
jgi:segregation and condensation protein A